MPTVLIYINNVYYCTRDQSTGRKARKIIETSAQELHYEHRNKHLKNIEKSSL